MSVLGTGVAAGVAQTGLQAQQTARERDRKKAHEAQTARKVRESFEAHLSTLEKVEHVEKLDPLQIDEHLPQHHSTPPQNQVEVENAQAQQGEHAATSVQGDSDSGPTPAEPTAAPSHGDHPLYHHIDIEG